MTREEILNEYKVDASGRIQSPGKFEGEMLYVPYFYVWIGEGYGDGGHEDGFMFGVSDTDRLLFPELKDTKAITLYEDDQGFVTAQTYS